VSTFPGHQNAVSFVVYILCFYFSISDFSSCFACPYCPLFMLYFIYWPGSYLFGQVHFGQVLFFQVLLFYPGSFLSRFFYFIQVLFPILETGEQQKNYSGEGIMLSPFFFYICTEDFNHFFLFSGIPLLSPVEKKENILFSTAKFSLIGIFSSSTVSTSRGTLFGEMTQKKNWT
jgi:hypothetical protein